MQATAREREREQRLIRQAKRGSREAQTALLAKYEYLLRGLTGQTKYRNKHDGDDLYQEACLAFLRAVQTYKSGRGTTLMTWCYRVIPQALWKVSGGNTIVRVPCSSRKAGKNAEAMQQAIRPWSRWRDRAGNEDPCRAIDDQDEVEWLRGAVGRLRIRLREVMQLRMQGEGRLAISRKLKCHRETVRLVEKRAIALLRH